ncbi:hypothetical protein [Nonomuraea sp. NPDC003804]
MIAAPEMKDRIFPARPHQIIGRPSRSLPTVELPSSHNCHASM